MKKTVLVLLAALSFTALAFAVDEPPFMPMAPEIMGEGGALTASAHGFASFFTNPAGFSRSPGDFTFTATTWMYARPDKVYDLITCPGGASGSSNLLSFINGEVTKGGFGLGGLTGIGWAGNGIGLGAFFLVDSYLYGPTLLGISGDLTGTVALIGGYSLPIQLGGLKLNIGGDIRPMIRIHTLVDSSVAINTIYSLANQGDIMFALNSADALHGAGIALDLGAIAELGWFSFGLSIRDVGGTLFNYNESSFGTVINSLSSSFSLPSNGASPSATYTIPMDVSAGVAFHPDFGIKWLVDPTIHLDCQDIVGVIVDERSPWTLLHIGAEARLFTVFQVQVGLNQGYLTAGGGVHLLFLDAYFALFTRELGKHLGDRPSSGASFEFAVRF